VALVAGAGRRCTYTVCTTYPYGRAGVITSKPTLAQARDRIRVPPLGRYTTSSQ
jgi:hypothetical protein